MILTYYFVRLPKAEDFVLIEVIFLDKKTFQNHKVTASYCLLDQYLMVYKYNQCYPHTTQMWASSSALEKLTRCWASYISTVQYEG